jgi:hypothetical protein
MKGMTISRLVAELLGDATDSQLPPLLAGLQSEEEGDR